MNKNHGRLYRCLKQRFPPSAPCSCDICRSYCQRPGWWTVAQAQAALKAGLGNRMMLELSPDLSFGVLAPAFRGCEQGFALQEFFGMGCTFLTNNLCELHGTALEPLECSYCHHTRKGLGIKCHDALARQWNTPAGQELVSTWMKTSGLWRQCQPIGL